MHQAGLLSLCWSLFSFISPVLSLPALQIMEHYSAVEKDLSKLSIKFAHCHIHTVLVQTDVSIHLMTSPHALTVRGGRGLQNRTSKTKIQTDDHGSLPIPSLTKMKNPCQAQIQVVLSQSVVHLAIASMMQGLYFDMEKTEGALMSYRLKEKHTVLLITRNSFYEGYVTNHEFPHDGPLTLALAGGNLLWSLIYSVHGSERRINTLQSGHLTCHPCLMTEHAFSCSKLEDCFWAMEHAYRVITEGGRSIRWPILPQPESQLTGTYSPLHEACFFPGKVVDCQGLYAKNILMDYMLGSLNRSALGIPLESATSWRLTPFIGWSEDDAAIEEIALIRISPLHIFPVYSPNKTKTSLRFITSDGIYQRNPSLYMYIQPLDHTIWLWTGLTFILVIMVVVGGSMTREGGGSSGCTALK